MTYKSYAIKGFPNFVLFQFHTVANGNML